MTFEQEDNDMLAHYIFLMILTTAFLGDPFEDVAMLAELYSKRNPCSSDLLVRFTLSEKPIPILQRFEDKGSLSLSQTLAWSASSITTSFRRVFH